MFYCVTTALCSPDLQPPFPPYGGLKAIIRSIAPGGEKANIRSSPPIGGLGGKIILVYRVDGYPYPRNRDSPLPFPI